MSGSNIIPEYSAKPIPKRRILRSFPLFVLLCISVLTVTGCNTMPSVIKDQIAQRLPTMLGPASHYDVNVNGSIFDLPRGKIESISVHGSNVELSNRLHVYDLVAVAHNIHADVRNNTVKSIGQTSFQLALSQHDLDNYFATDTSKRFSHDAHIGLNWSDLTFSDKLHFLGLSTSYTVTGELKLVPGQPNKMNFVPSKASIDSLGIPIGLVKLAVNRQNPVVDLSAMKYPVAINNASISQGLLHIFGNIDVVALLNSAKAEAAKTATHG